MSETSKLGNGQPILFLFSCIPYFQLSGQAALSQLLAAVPRPTDDQVRRALDDVLSRHEFSPARQSNWFQRILEWMGGFFGWLGELGESSPSLFWLLLVGCLVLLLLLVAHLAWSVRRGFFTGTGKLRKEKAPERRDRLSLTYWEEAGRRAALMDFTEAIRFLFLSLVYRFDERGRVNFQQAYTNREYLALFMDRPPVYDQLKVFVDTLDDYWYGQRGTDQGRYENCLALYRELVR